MICATRSHISVSGFTTLGSMTFMVRAATTMSVPTMSGNSSRTSALGSRSRGGYWAR